MNTGPGWFPICSGRVRRQVPPQDLLFMLETVVVSARSFSQIVLDAPQPVSLLLFGIGMILVSKNVKARRTKRRLKPEAPAIQGARPEPLSKTAAA
jgi:hypothetical protein